jgi:hypothetical protein
MMPIAVQGINNIKEDNSLIMQDIKGAREIMNEKPIPEPLQPRSVRVKVKGDKKKSLLLQVASNSNFQTDIINGYVTSFPQQHLWEFM